MRSTPIASLDAHLDLLPMHLLLNEACQRSAFRLAATPIGHPLHKAVAKCATGRKRHPPPLQSILKFAKVKPTDYENWPLGQRPLPNSMPDCFPDRNTAANLAEADTAHIKVFTDGTAGQVGVAAAAIMYEAGGQERRTGIRMGEPGEVSILDAEVAGILLAAHLITTAQNHLVVDDATIYTDSQAAILCINGHTKGASHGLLKATRNAIWKARKGSGGTIVQLKWCPGHAGIQGNVAADREASKAAAGHHYRQHPPPPYLIKYQPLTNPTTRKRVTKEENRELAATHWAASDAGIKHADRFPNLPPRHFLNHVRGLTRSRATLLYRLTSGHIQLRKHLHRLQLTDSPRCEQCGEASETVTHFLLECPHYIAQRSLYLGSQGRDFLRLSFLLHAPCALDPLFDYVKATGRFPDLIR